MRFLFGAIDVRVVRWQHQNAQVAVGRANSTRSCGEITFEAQNSARDGGWGRILGARASSTSRVWICDELRPT
jgi:hypothetical protein